MVGNNRGRLTSHTAGVAGIVADNSRHSRHPWRSMQRRPSASFILTRALSTTSNGFKLLPVASSGRAESVDCRLRRAGRSRLRPLPSAVP